MSFSASAPDNIPYAINLPNIYFSGLLPPAEQLNGVWLRVHVEILSNSGTMQFYENNLPIGVLTALPGGYYGYNLWFDAYGQFRFA